MKTSREEQTMAPFELPRALTIQHVEDLMKQLDALPAEQDLALDGQAVELVDALGVQLLLALRKRQQQGGHGFTLQQPSEALREALNDLGLADALQH
ncbi:MAG: STAS domain-containing protein [Gammaproteobacteria bacterium]|nr:MAG: STAS domain-containing protein [Gammaproteobacteria bacterium]